MPISDPIELKLRLKKSKRQGDGKLLEYLLSHPTLGSADAVMEALRAYWMPLAFFHSGSRDPAVLREVGWKAIGDLEMQIKLIERVLQLESPTDKDRIPYMPVAQSPSSVPAESTPHSKTPEELDDELGLNDFS